MQCIAPFRPSICQAHIMCKNETNLCPHSYSASKIVHPSFLTQRLVGGGPPLVPQILGQTDPIQAKMSIFNRYSLVEPQS